MGPYNSVITPGNDLVKHTPFQWSQHFCFDAEGLQSKSVLQLLRTQASPALIYCSRESLEEGKSQRGHVRLKRSAGSVSLPKENKLLQSLLKVVKSKTPPWRKQRSTEHRGLLSHPEHRLRPRGPVSITGRIPDCESPSALLLPLSRDASFYPN